MSTTRRVVVAASGAAVELVNVDHAGLIDQVRSALSPEQILHAMDAIGLARERIDANLATLTGLGERIAPERAE